MSEVLIVIGLISVATIFGSMIFFSCVSSLVNTPALPVSDPVPAVVGIAIIGFIEPLLALVQ